MKYSVIIPVYNSELTIREVVRRSILFFTKQHLDFEIVLVNDNSNDRSWKTIQKLAIEYHHILAINLARNLGQHKAILAGLRHSKGDRIITLDDDLQNPPEEMSRLISTMHNGFDIVYARYEQKQHADYRKIGSYLISFFNQVFFNKPRDLTISNFRIFDSHVASRVVAMSTRFVYLPGMLLLSALHPGNVETIHLPRVAGKSGYSFVKLARVTFTLISLGLQTRFFPSQGRLFTNEESEITEIISHAN